MTDFSTDFSADFGNFVLLFATALDPPRGPMNHATAITVPGSGKLAVPGTLWMSFSNSGAEVLVIDTVGGEEGVSITLPSGMWPIRATAIYSTTTVTNLVGYWE